MMTFSCKQIPTLQTGFTVYFHQAEVIQWEPLTIMVGNKTIFDTIVGQFQGRLSPSVLVC